ncbi:DUF397 domain-containing protein [Streptomyces sp. NA04227]|uniref:DUF397 domain-containing protein n=1 Tax=Streptomyces sp. NA04227 TaxID=2742136 RepID=UPI0015918337|nr:DUF397 domain-containing protein [Streptomyces sp. NA04227]QKW08367.1 DUF397 domain-containing protein [Streptomyces sp. NA04227]
MNTDLMWFKSSYSGDEGGACLEVAADWRKSTHSGSEGGACLEISPCPTAIHIRDSKTPEGPILTLGRDAWSAFTSYAQVDPTH